MVSVIIPCYNVAPYIDECLESLALQTYPHFEALLIEDASKDDTLQKCQAWVERDHRFKLWAQPHNQGVSAARNRGLELAKHEWLLFLDSDDHIAPDHIESMLRAAQEGDALMVHCGYYRENNSESKCAKDGMNFSGTISSRDYLIELIKDKRIGSFLYKHLFHRSLFFGITFPEGELYEDFRVMPYIVEKTARIVHSGKATYYYRYVSNSIIHSLTFSRKVDFFYAVLARWGYLDHTQVLTPREKKLLLPFMKKPLYRAYCEAVELSDPHNSKEKEIIASMERALAQRGVRAKGFWSPSSRYFFYSLGKRYAEWTIHSDKKIR